MIKPIFNINIKSLFKDKTTLKMTDFAKTLVASPQVKSKTIKKLNNLHFEEIRTFKNGTKVSRLYETDDKFEKLQLIQKTVLPAKNNGKTCYNGGVEYETIYTKANKFFAILKSDCLNCNYTTFLKNPTTGKIDSIKGLGAFNKAISLLNRSH